MPVVCIFVYILIRKVLRMVCVHVRHTPAMRPRAPTSYGALPGMWCWHQSGAQVRRVQ